MERIYFCCYTLLISLFSGCITYAVLISRCKSTPEQFKLTCEVIGSCEGAKYWYSQGHKELDGDKDGTPCDLFCQK